MIEVAGVGRTYADGTVALRGVDLRVRAGEFVGLMGRSGSGKTTLLRLLDGAIQPDPGGALRVLGADMAALRGRELGRYRRRVGVVYQQHGLVPSLPVLHNVLLGRVGSMGAARALLSLLYVPGEQVSAIADALSELGVEAPLRRARATSRAGSSSAWRWRALSGNAPGSCSPTNRQRPWTRRPPR